MDFSYICVKQNSFVKLLKLLNIAKLATLLMKLLNLVSLVNLVTRFIVNTTYENKSNYIETVLKL